MTTPVAARISLAAIAGAVITLSSAQAGGCGGAECYRHVNTPPVYGAVSEQVLVRPAETVYRTIPPVYETVSERILVAPGGRVWQTRRDAYGALIGCWVDVPPQYASVRRRVLVQPARSGWVPANYGQGGYPGAFGPSLAVGSIPDAFGVTGASSADIGVGLGFSSGSIYDGY